MQFKNKTLLIVLLFSCNWVSLQLQARTYLEAKLVAMARAEEEKPKAHEYYGSVMRSMEAGQFEEAITNSYHLLKQYPDSVLVAEAVYMRGVAFFEKKEYRLAEEALSRYLNEFSSLKHFEDAVRYKFRIAEAYARGAKKRLFEWRKSPKWVSAKEDALRIYDEVITSLPRNELAAQSLYRKGKLLVEMSDYKEAVEAFRTLIRRFQKHPLSPEGYLAIAHTYLKQSESQFPDPDHIEMAEINLRKFQSDFPGEGRIQLAEQMLIDMRGNFAKELYQNARYYEKKKKEHAAFLYYSTILQKYPTTEFAKKAVERIAQLKKRSKDPEALVL